MVWVLRVREPESGFIGHADNGGLVIVSEPDEALEFQSETEMQTFKNNVLQSDVSSAWHHRSPQLFPVRMGARSFIIEVWACIFQFLERISFFGLVRGIVGGLSKLMGKPSPTESYVFVEVWVLMWCAIAFSLLGVMTWIKPEGGSLLFILTAVGVWRVAEIVAYQVNVVLFHEWRSKRQHASVPYAVRSYRRLVVLTIHNYFEILLWFAMFYVRAASCFHTACDGLSLETMSGAVYHSMLTMTTLGYGDIYPLRGEWVAAFLAVAQTMIGVFLSLVVLARVIALIPRPLSMDENEGV